MKTGKTPVLDISEWRRLLAAIPTDTVRDRRDRALFATLTSYARDWRTSMTGRDFRVSVRSSTDCFEEILSANKQVRQRS
jgi:hypothetical protein